MNPTPFVVVFLLFQLPILDRTHSAADHLFDLRTFSRRQSSSVLYHRRLNLRLHNLMRRVDRKLAQPNLLQRREAPQRIICPKRGADVVLDLRFGFAVVRAYDRERLGAKNMVRDWYYNCLYEYR